MRLLPAPEALEFAAEVDKLLGDGCGVAALRAAWDAPDGRVPGLWERLAEVGVLGLPLPERAGGAGADLTFALPVLVATGRHAVPEPLVETLAAAVALAAAGGATAAEWLPRVAGGSARLALGPGPTGVVSGAAAADLLLLADDEAVWAVPAGAVDVTALPSVDRGVRLATVAWSPADAVGRLDAAAGAAAYDWAVVATAAQLVGLAGAMLDMAVRYAQQREQFGRPIGEFQAVKHQLADVYVALSFAEPVVRRAAWSVTRALPTRARDASHAKHAATGAARRAARTALQVHGAIGYTFEHELHMWLKRTWTLSSLWGTEADHLRRVTDAVLAGDTARVP